ncbi:hypothetical protein [Butyrivibrio sp.]|uniref:hypothetical protein n=1 Tax=Butyrivibrio sp. TaxID=28121 RepID=UPI0025C408E8|nr:hypothetical protein [Butyrivibrio sp.]MBQ9302318.1 hypothetical protein [Butyrivibrio sp.]
MKLNISAYDIHILDKRFFIAFIMQNKLITHAKKQLSCMRQDKHYRYFMDEYVKLKGNDDPQVKCQRQLIGEELLRIRQAYGLSEYQFHDWISVQQHRYKKHIDSLTAQKIATRVWKSVEDVLFKKGKNIHYKKLASLMSVEGKNNASGIRFVKGRLCWNGLIIQPQIHK